MKIYCKNLKLSDPRLSPLPQSKHFSRILADRKTELESGNENTRRFLCLVKNQSLLKKGYLASDIYFVYRLDWRVMVVPLWRRIFLPIFFSR